MIYKNALITTKDEQFLGYLEVDDKGTIIKIGRGTTNKKGIDCKKLILMPAFIDSHTHGGYGFSFQEIVNENWQNKLENYLEKIHQHEGVAAVNITTVTDTWENILKISKNLLNLKNTSILNWYLEGPFISKEKKGAHKEELIIPIEEKHLNELNLNKKIKSIIAIAPENNNNELLKKFKKHFYYTIGHSNCYDFSKKFNLNTFDFFTHFYNGCSSFDHRQESLVNTILNNKLSKNFLVEFISDGIHTTKEIINFTYKNIDKNNLIIISDSLSPKGLENGDYWLGPLEITKKNDIFYLKNQNKIAGSGMPYNKILNVFHKATNCTWSEMVLFSSYNIAKKFKKTNKFGTLKLNQKGNFVLIDKNFNIKMSFINNKHYTNEN
ncbi:amidohydrolase family protein [Mesomycoplasma neurolyticum]|uniref:N-acetylglucosamine-6-phosphate deacetylase n=1 Tax=Mesomycoplasma neurolyticum TaxID=2120 RepID=A0A449A6E1_9BACT|nr:amidohydrolase family protein [Mesomycoplasma neurolyticum]VEU59798.1 N-acetylglucosamine-6-phosphate deacetylase [Mesomycoplasma neurolyticum]